MGAFRATAKDGVSNVSTIMAFLRHEANLTGMVRVARLERETLCLEVSGPLICRFYCLLITVFKCWR